MPHQPSSGRPASAVAARSDLPPERLVPRVAEFPPPEQFFGWGLFPRVLRIDPDLPEWRTPGARRVHLLADGGTCREQLLAYDGRTGFAYELTFTGIFDRFVRSIRGVWDIASDGSGSTARWTWTYTPQRFGWPVVALVIAPLWSRYMRRMVSGPMAGLLRL